MKVNITKGGASSAMNVRTNTRAGGLASSPLGYIPPGPIVGQGP